MKSGPSLHLEDKALLTDGPIKREHLISIRKGEMAFSPGHDEPDSTIREFIKISGKGKSWECLFLDRDGNECLIYEHRPLECRLLECWDTSALEDVAGQYLLTRADIIEPDNPVNGFIRIHDLKCPVPELEMIRSAMSPGDEGSEALAELTELVNLDLAIRVEAVHKLDLSMPLELFFFGRPIHIMLKAHGLYAVERNGVVQITTRLPDCHHESK
jgi:hypothetical protein